MNHTYPAVVLRAIDGDTIEAVVALAVANPIVGIASVTVTRTVRLSGIDAPEVRGPTREAGLRSKARLAELVEGKRVVLECEERRDKYQRILATIRLEGVEASVNETLVAEGLAVVRVYLEPPDDE